MKYKIALIASLPLFIFSLTSFADDAIEIVITATAPSGSSNSSNIPKDNPNPSGSGQNQGAGYADAKNKEAAAAAAGKEAERKAKLNQFCKSEPGNILATKTTCELNASRRDEARQDSCWNISLSWNGFGWTNPCRADSSLRYRTDLAICADDYQKNTNSYNAICNK